MTLYVDSSALLKRYVDERDSAFAEQAMGDDPVLVTSRITESDAIWPGCSTATNSSSHSGPSTRTSTTSHSSRSTP